MDRSNCKIDIKTFLTKPAAEVIGELNIYNQFDTRLKQNKSWEEQIFILKKTLQGVDGTIFFEFPIPRLGKRIDAVVVASNIVFVIEFKVGAKFFLTNDIDQVWDYALDLKNFHTPCHTAIVIPILVATDAEDLGNVLSRDIGADNLSAPLCSNGETLKKLISELISVFKSQEGPSGDEFDKGVYRPTPSIIEAAISLFNSHSVDEITRSDSGAINLSRTASEISSLIDYAKFNRRKVICFVTGVPGAGKTLVGLKVATTHLDQNVDSKSVYLSGNAPLVSILQEALSRDKIKREKELGNQVRKGQVKQAVKSFIQIIHHYRDAYLKDSSPPYDHVAIFDEAQRVWNREQTIKFMRQKKNHHDFDFSEPEFFISCLDRHQDWALIVCLVGGGQEINTGEAGISEWLHAVGRKFPNWEVHISPNLSNSDYNAGVQISYLPDARLKYNENLHLSVSMRSFRAENVSNLIKYLLDRDVRTAQLLVSEIGKRYPIVLTRNIDSAKKWLKEKARGTERYGIVVSSKAQRLKPFAIDVKSPIDHINWFLGDKHDVRSSYFLEDVATEFHVQGLELDWVCVAWDGDLRYSKLGWETYSFQGSKWQNIRASERKNFLINAYRVLLTRARQGMIILVPQGNQLDETRKPEFYDPTFEYLKSLGFATC